MECSTVEILKSHSNSEIRSYHSLLPNTCNIIGHPYHNTRTPVGCHIPVGA